MKYLSNACIVFVLAVFMVQCEVVSDDLLQNPNSPSQGNASPDFLLNSMQIENENLYQAMNEKGAEVTRMLQMVGTRYDNAFQPQNLDFEWEKAYADILIDAKTLIPLATERELFVHAGIARVLRAYTLINLVDYFGDVPLSEALDESNFNPGVDTGADIYAAALVELDSARIDLAKEALAGPANDLYYDGDADAWITLANTLELKVLYQQRLVADNSTRINELLNGDVIDEADEEFVFQFSTNSSNPDSRHPEFIGNYLNGAAEYMSNYYMNELWQDKAIQDPRIRYYFYRQVAEPTTDVNEQDCINNLPPTHYDGNGNGEGVNDPFCEDWNDVGYWGRDHGNDDGIPPDNFLRTNFGVYPVGGRFDADQAEGVDPSDGLQGAGIHPMWMPFFTDFVRAEVALTLGNDEDAARAALEDGMRNSFEFVFDFSEAAVAAEDTSGMADPAGNVNAYVNEVLSRFDNASGADKLHVLAKEFYLALWGNGIEAYNLYRRIAPPQDAPNWNLQPNLSPSTGSFVRSMRYPSAFTERNSSVNPKEISVQIFWDTNPSGFADF